MMMRSTGIRALKNGLSGYLRRLKPGEVLAITDRGRIIAELRKVGPTPLAAPVVGRYEHLVSIGVIRPASKQRDPLKNWPKSRKFKLPRGTASRWIDEDRG